MKPISTVPRALDTVDVASGEAGQGDPPALRRVRRAGRRGRRRGDGRAGAGRRVPGEVRRRLGGRDRAQPRGLPRVDPGGDAHVVTRPARRASSSSGRPARARRTVGRRAGRRARCAAGTTPTPRSRPAPGASIADIFVEHGEPHFRELERAEVAPRAGRARRGARARRGSAARPGDRRRLSPGTPWSSSTSASPTPRGGSASTQSRPLLMVNPRAPVGRS